MKNVARFSDNDKRRLFRNTADKMGLNDAIVEKDFGYALRWIICFNVPPGKIRLPLRAVPACRKPFV